MDAVIEEDVGDGAVEDELVGRLDATFMGAGALNSGVGAVGSVVVTDAFDRLFSVIDGLTCKTSGRPTLLCEEGSAIAWSTIIWPSD